MPKSAKTATKKKKNKVNLQDKIDKLKNNITEKLESIRKERIDYVCFPLFLGSSHINHSMVDDTYEELRTNYKDCNGKLDVIVDSGGGDIDAAYNLANLFRKYGGQELNFIVPRWAKSAATLLACSGNKIYMTPVAELGPLDPQITVMNPMDKRLEHFSPLHIESTLELIRNEFKKGNKELAKGLMERLQFPLTLGSFRKSLDVSKQYLEKLLSTRMFNGKSAKKKAESISKQLTTGYADHGFCINSDEAKLIGLEVVDLEGNLLDLVWDVHKINREVVDLEQKIKEEVMSDFIDNLPPGALEKLLPEQDQTTPKRQ